MLIRSIRNAFSLLLFCSFACRLPPGWCLGLLIRLFFVFLILVVTTKVTCNVNPFTPDSDKYLISLNNVTPESNMN